MSGLRLTSDERRRILEGDHSALKRDENPGDVEGQEIPILRRRAHKRIEWETPRFSGEAPRYKDTVAMPEHWSLWIVLGKPTRHRKGHWQIEITVHDERQVSRSLAPSAGHGPPTESGLRTRAPSKPRLKGEGVGKFNAETARGYGGGPQAIDHGAVDDDELRRQRVQANLRRAEHLQAVGSDEERRSQERRARQLLRERLQGLDPEAQAILLARVEAAIRGEVDEERAA